MKRRHYNVLSVTVVILSNLRHFSIAWNNCSDSVSICPSLATCCPTATPKISSCISGSDKSNLAGDCCTDDDILGSTGCGQGYVCAYDAEHNYPHCKLVTPVGPEHPPIVPRYRLCQLPSRALTEVYGLPIYPNSVTEPQISYYSTLGAIDAGDAITLTQHAQVETIVIVIHGSARNADDYLCCTNSALPEKDQGANINSTIMVIAPWLRTPLDPPVNLISHVENAVPLVWAEDGPIDHTWRYGADALNANFSAYAVMDTVLDRLNRDRVRFPRLRQVVVAGHSAGGQYTQRWALLSNSPALDQHRADTRLHVRTVVANPRSFCFLDNRRFIDGTFQIPTEDLTRKCKDYDSWEWGLGNDTVTLVAPYKDESIMLAGGVEAVVQRYATRDVVYLAGELDLDTSANCRAKLQGSTRRERSQMFMASLKEIYGTPVHHRLVVHGVYHNHCLMFQSPEGKQSLFGLRP